MIPPQSIPAARSTTQGSILNTVAPPSWRRVHPRITILSAVVFLTLSVSACSDDGPKIPAVINQAASLTPDSLSPLPANPLQWQVIASEFSKADSTMSTLYGNDVAIAYARSHDQHDYPSGAILSLVTWTQREDPRWFGARIPNHLKSVEFVFAKAATDARVSYAYEKYDGVPLQKLSTEEISTLGDRATYLLAQRASVFP